ncbi:MAG: DUF2240 family protein [Desulfobacterales bacterium]|nr:DUF2240 family protein [Desulfobacterales bacterium]
MMLTFDQIVQKIMAGAGISRDDTLTKIRDMQNELHGFVTVEGAASIVASQLGVSLEGALIDFTPAPSRSTRTETEEKRMGVSDIYPPSLLNVATANDRNLWDKPLTITGQEVREFERDKTRKIVLKLEGVDVGIGLNITNARTLAKAWGDDYRTWTGKQIKLVRVRVLFKGQQTDSIGVVAV